MPSLSEWFSRTSPFSFWLMFVWLKSELGQDHFRVFDSTRHAKLSSQHSRPSGHESAQRRHGERGDAPSISLRRPQRDVTPPCSPPSPVATQFIREVHPSDVRRQPMYRVWTRAGCYERIWPLQGRVFEHLGRRPVVSY